MNLSRKKIVILSLISLFVVHQSFGMKKIYKNVSKLLSCGNSNFVQEDVLQQDTVFGNYDSVYQDFTLVNTLQLFEHPFRSPKLRFSGNFCQDGSRFVITRGDSRLTLLCKEKQELKRRTISGYVDVDSVALSKDGRLLAWGLKDGQIYVMDIDKKEEVFSFKEIRAITGLCFSDDNKYLISISPQSVPSNKVYDIKKGKKLFGYRHNHRPARCVAFSKDSKYVVSGGVRNDIQLWDIENEKRIFSGNISDMNHEVRGLSLSDDKRYLFIWSNFIGIYDLQDRKYVFHRKAYRNMGFGFFSTAALTKDRKRVIAVMPGGIIRIYDIDGDPGGFMHNYKDIAQGTNLLKLSACETFMVLTSYENKLKIYDIKNKESVLDFDADEFVSMVTFTPDYKQMFAITEKGLLYIFNTSSDFYLRNILALKKAKKDKEIKNKLLGTLRKPNKNAKQLTDIVILCQK